MDGKIWKKNPISKTNYELVVGNVVTGSHGYGINVHKSSGNQILNNTCAYNGYLNWHTQFVLEYDLSADNIVENNVGISGEGQNVFAVTAGAENASGNICDYNCWFRVGTEDIIKWGDIFNLTLEEFRNVSGYFHPFSWRKYCYHFISFIINSPK
jgi:parallel beta-helix repeat protein